MKTLETLRELRGLASELDLELIYMIGQSKVEHERVTNDNYSSRKHIGLLRDGEIYMQPVSQENLMWKLRRAVLKHVKRTMAAIEADE